MNVIFEIIIGYLIADFIMGIYHWIKDTYFGPFSPIIGETFIWGSRLHHIRPRYVIEFSDWQLFKSSAIWTFLWMAPLFYLFGRSVWLMSIYLTISLNDVVHKYSHMYDHERPLFMTILQKSYLIQSHDEHHAHHIEPHTANYCPISPFLNLFLERINFWRNLENLIEFTTGYKPRAREYDFVENENYPAGVEFLP